MGFYSWPPRGAAAGTGDVNGPATSTNNALARWSGLTGTLLKDGPGILDDFGNLSGINDFEFNGDGSISGTLEVGGNVTFFGLFDLSGSADFAGGLIVGGDVVFQQKLDVTGIATFYGSASFDNGLTITSGQLTAQSSLLSALEVTGNTILRGNLEVQGTQSYLNVQDLLVEDKNIQVNWGGTNASAAGAGLEVVGTSNNPLASFEYDSTLASRFRIGPTGSLKEVLAATPGSSGQFLRSNGSSSPTYQTVLGFVPVGAILATISNLTGAYDCTATNSADALGFVLCNGQTISDGSSPMNGAVIPNINNSRFLMGSTTPGSAGGAASVTLALGNLPTHNHTINHDHAAFTSAAGSAHTHGVGTLANSASSISGTANSGVNLAHSHGVSDPGHGHNFTIPLYYNNAGGVGSNAAVAQVASVATAFGAAANATGISINNSASLDHSHTLSGTAAAQAISGSTAADSSHTHSIDVPAFTGTSGDTGSGTSFSILPSYITAKYIMRIK